MNPDGHEDAGAGEIFAAQSRVQLSNTVELESNVPTGRTTDLESTLQMDAWEAAMQTFEPSSLTGDAAIQAWQSRVETFQHVDSIVQVTSDTSQPYVSSFQPALETSQPTFQISQPAAPSVAFPTTLPSNLDITVLIPMLGPFLTCHEVVRLWYAFEMDSSYLIEDYILHFGHDKNFLADVACVRSSPRYQRLIKFYNAKYPEVAKRYIFGNNYSIDRILPQVFAEDDVEHLREAFDERIDSRDIARPSAPSEATTPGGENHRGDTDSSETRTLDHRGSLQTLGSFDTGHWSGSTRGVASAPATRFTMKRIPRVDFVVSHLLLAVTLRAVKCVRELLFRLNTSQIRIIYRNSKMSNSYIIDAPGVPNNQAINSAQTINIAQATVVNLDSKEPDATFAKMLAAISMKGDDIDRQLQHLVIEDYIFGNVLDCDPAAFVKSSMERSKRAVLDSLLVIGLINANERLLRLCFQLIDSVDGSTDDIISSKTRLNGANGVEHDGAQSSSGGTSGANGVQNTQGGSSSSSASPRKETKLGIFASLTQFVSESEEEPVENGIPIGKQRVSFKFKGEELNDFPMLAVLTKYFAISISFGEKLSTGPKKLAELISAQCDFGTAAKKDGQFRMQNYDLKLRNLEGCLKFLVIERKFNPAVVGKRGESCLHYVSKKDTLIEGNTLFPMLGADTSLSSFPYPSGNSGKLPMDSGMRSNTLLSASGYKLLSAASDTHHDISGLIIAGKEKEIERLMKLGFQLNETDFGLAVQAGQVDLLQFFKDIMTRMNMGTQYQEIMHKVSRSRRQSLRDSGVKPP